MYSVYAGSTCIYDDTSNAQNLRLINPVLELADSAAGSFKMTVPVTNIGYDLIERLTTRITVMKDGNEMWEGRVIDESIDYWKNRTLTCEGELAYLNDSIQPPAEYHDVTVREFLTTLINNHNVQCESSKHFLVGAVTVVDSNDALYRYTNYEKTIDCINDKLIGRLGGHLSVRKDNGVRYLDYLADKQSTNTQVIEFGENLLDYTASFDMTEYATVLVPLGEKLEESPIAALEAYTTVAPVNDDSIYVVNDDAVAQYGWIVKTVHFDRVTEPNNLLRKAQQYLSEVQFSTMVLEVKAIDLHYLNPSIEGVKLTDQIRVISEPHGLNKIFPVTKLSIPLDQPENTVFTLGDAIKTSLTEVNNKTSSEILNKIEDVPTKQSVLNEAKANAQAIMDLVSNGFITITHNDNGSEELYISDNQDILQSTRLWRWNINGLAYGTKEAGDPVEDTVYSIAMTMDGAIVADRITAGTLRADLLDAVRIKASTFFLQNETTETYPEGSLYKIIHDFQVTDGQLTSQIQSTDGRVTALRQDVAGITLSATSGLPKTDVGTFDGTVPAGGYSFTRTSDGYYTSGNAGVDSSYSYGRLTFNFASSTVVSFDCISNGESSYDFGILSNLDASLTTSANEDVEGVFHSFKNEAGPDVKTLSLTVPSGQHFVTFKYIKDSGTSSGDDTFKINAYTGTGQNGSTITLTSGGIVSTSANIVFNGLVTFNDLSGTGTTQINGANIMTGTISADAIHVTTVYKDNVPIIYSYWEPQTGSNKNLYIIMGNSDLRDGTGEIRMNLVGDSILIGQTIAQGYSYDKAIGIYPEQVDVGDDEYFKAIIPLSSSQYEAKWSLGAADDYFDRIYVGLGNGRGIYFSDGLSSYRRDGPAYLTYNPTMDTLVFWSYGTAKIIPFDM